MPRLIIHGNGILPYNSESESTAHNNGMGAGLRAHSSQQRQENSKKYDKDLAEVLSLVDRSALGATFVFMKQTLVSLVV